MNSTPRKKAVSYLRVSTARQGRSGLGLEAQREAVNNYCASAGLKALKEFVEIESGKDDDRPKLAAALHYCKVSGATLVIAKLDRLSRSIGFIDRLQESKTKFVAADMPEANDLTVSIMAAMAKHERQMTSQRTTATLQAAKRRGVKLGNPNGADALRRARKGNKAAVKTIVARADERATDILPIIADIKKSGMLTLAEIADELNNRGIQSARGGNWHASTVQRLLQR